MTRVDTHVVARLAVAVLLAIAAAGIGWLAFRAAVVRALPAQAPLVARVAPGDAATNLDRLVVDTIGGNGRSTAAARARVRAMAQRLPLDERPFFLTAVERLNAGREAEGIRLLEETRRRNPRMRLARLALLDRYLRAGRLADATTEMTVLARLLPSAGGVLATEFARLAGDPRSSARARQALGSDPPLLGQVLKTMARAGVDPVAVVRFAGAGAPAGLESDGWMRALIDARIARGDYARAYALWSRAYRVAGGPGGRMAIYDGGFRKLPGGPPFGWSVHPDETGSADIGGGIMTVEYYARRSGELASQLLLLPPGDYRLSYAIEGSGGGDDSGLSWTLACAADETKPFVTTIPPPLAPTRKVHAADFTVPATGCGAQRLKLVGFAPEFAAPASARISRLAIAPR